MNDDYAFRFQYADGSAFQIYADGRAYIMAKDGSVRDKPKGVVTNRIPMLIGSVAKPRQDEIERLRKGIQDYLDGNYASPRDGRAVSPQQKCPHGMFYWDACENCIDEHFSRLLDGMEGREPRAELSSTERGGEV